MANLAGVYVTAHGQWTLTPWLAERAQIGLRLTIHEAGADPALGEVFTVPTGNGDIVQDIGTYNGTNGTLQRAWKARLGAITSNENADDVWQADIAEDFRTFLLAVAPWQSSGFRWTHVKIAGQTATGAAPFGAGTYTFTAPVVGSAGVSTPLPPEVAVALSLRAPISGRRGRGRMYLPGLSLNQLAMDGTVKTDFAGAMNTAAKALFTALEDAPGTEGYGPIVTIMSAGSSVGVRPSQVRVGSHFDVQRRRQHQADESYTSLAL